MLKLTRILLIGAISYGLLAVGFSSCSTFDPPLVVPAYGHIDSIHFTVPLDSSIRLGTASSNIQYAWVYLDDNPVGSFQMPCTFPIIASNGMHNIKVYPGITPVGGTSAAAIYPFYQFYSVNVNLQQGVTTKFHPTSQYYIWSEFPYKENFGTAGEDAGGQPKFIINYHGGGNPSAATTTSMVITNKHNLAFDGKNSGMVVVNQGHQYYIGMTWPWDSLPANGSTPVYVEFNYRATAPFSVGMFENDTLTQIQPLAVVYPSATWTKMYVSLNTTLTAFQLYPYNVYFSLSLPTGDVSDTLLLANIKILD